MRNLDDCVTFNFVVALSSIFCNSSFRISFSKFSKVKALTQDYIKERVFAFFYILASLSVIFFDKMRLLITLGILLVQCILFMGKTLQISLTLFKEIFHVSVRTLVFACPKRIFDKRDEIQKVARAQLLG